MGVVGHINVFNTLSLALRKVSGTWKIIIIC